MSKLSNQRYVLLIYVLLAIATFAVYSQLHKNDFINYDDDIYVTKNPHVTSGLNRQSVVWAFTRPGVPKYCSVTVPLYIGLGASGGSYLKDVFYLNTFHVAEYISALEDGKMPIAVSLDLSERTI